MRSNTSPVIDIAQAIQATFAEAGVQLEIQPQQRQADADQVRARNHDGYIGRWGPNYRTRTATPTRFAEQSRQSRRGQAHRQTSLARRLGRPCDDRQDRGRGAQSGTRPGGRQMYEALQRERRADLAVRDPVSGRRADRRARQRAGDDSGPSFDDNRCWHGHKE